MIPAFAIVGELRETVPVVNFDVEKVKHREPEQAGNFRPDSVAHVREVKGYNKAA